MGVEDTARWDPDHYDGDHAYVYEYGEAVLDWLAPSPDERILDLGCGTGHLTAAIAESGAECIGLDRSREMVTTAKASYPSLQFVRGDAHWLAFDRSFDAVFTNATLHWLDAPAAAFESIAGVLRPGGRFVGEFGGTGNVTAITDAVMDELDSRGFDRRHPWYFPSVGEFASDLEPRGFEVRRAELFDRPVELEGGANGLRSWLSMFGGSLFEAVPDGELSGVLDGVEERLRESLYRDGIWVADYRRLRFAAVRT